MKSYDYIYRKGIRAISWEEFSEIATRLSEELYRENIEVIVGIAKAGLLVATLISCRLRCEFFPVRVTRRLRDRVVYENPVWKVDVSKEVRDKKVAVIDEIADTGKTLSMVASRVKEIGASKVVKVSLVSHSWADPFPDLTGVISDELIVFPWDRRVYLDGSWLLNPEIQEAMRLQIRR